MRVVPCRMSLTCAKLAAEKEAAELAPDEVKSETSTVRPGADTRAAPAGCGVAPSGSSWTGLPAGSGGLLEPTSEERRADVAPSKDSRCLVEGMPRQSWLRRRRKHWPYQSRSTVFKLLCEKTDEEPRCNWQVHNNIHDERRHHFPGRSNA